MLNLAKLNSDDLKQTSQTIYFTDNNLHLNNFKLLQFDTNLFSEISAGNKLYIKGDDEDEVVFCSNAHTFNVTEAETSNSLLLVKNLKFNDSLDKCDNLSINKVVVHGIFYEYLEAVLGKPRFKKLHLLLADSLYRGPEYEHTVSKDKLYSFEKLSNTIQASNEELKAALKSMNVVEIDGNIRILDFEYHFRVLSYMLKLIDENSWQLDEINYEDTVDALKELVPKEVIECLFETYTEESQIQDVQLYRYREREVCRFFAEVLLRGAGKFNLNEFLQAWKESVPEGMIPDEEMLYGIAIVDRKVKPNVVWAFEENSLPDNINERFKILFEIKEKWSVPEISPYIM